MGAAKTERVAVTTSAVPGRISLAGFMFLVNLIVALALIIRCSVKNDGRNGNRFDVPSPPEIGGEGGRRPDEGG